MTEDARAEYRNWRTSIRLQLLVLLFGVVPIAVFLLNGACVEPVPRSAPPPRDDPSIPGLADPRTGAVGSIDAVWPHDDAVHVVWTEGPGSSFGGPCRLFYSRALDGGARWSPPTELATEWSYNSTARILQADDGLHIFFSGRLRHLVSTDGGQSWIERPAMLPFDADRIESVDVIATKGGICVAYISSLLASGQPGQKQLTIARLSLAGIVESSRDDPLAGEMYGGSFQFLSFGRNLFLFGSGTPISHVVSEDGGRSWGEPQHAAFPWGRARVRVSVRDGRLAAIWNLNQIYVSQSQDGIVWTEPVWLTGGAVGMSVALRAVEAGGDDGGLIVWNQHIVPQQYGPGPDPKIEHVYAQSMRDVLAASDRKEQPLWPGFLPASANASGLTTVSNGKQRLVLWHDSVRSITSGYTAPATRIRFTPYPIAGESELERLRAATIDGAPPSATLWDPVTGRIMRATIRIAHSRWDAETELKCLAGPVPEHLSYQVVFFVPGLPKQRWATEPLLIPYTFARMGSIQLEPGGALPLALAEKLPSKLYAMIMVSPDYKPVDVTAIPESTLYRGAVRVVIDRRPPSPQREGPDGPRH